MNICCLLVGHDWESLAMLTSDEWHSQKPDLYCLRDGCDASKNKYTGEVRP